MTRHVRWWIAALALGSAVSAAGCEVTVYGEGAGDALSERKARMVAEQWAAAAERRAAAAEQRATAAEQRASDWQTYFAISCCAATALFPLGIVLGAWLHSRNLAAGTHWPEPRARQRRRQESGPWFASASGRQEPAVRVVCPGCQVAGRLPQGHAGQIVRCKRCATFFFATVSSSAVPALSAEAWTR